MALFQIAEPGESAAPHEHKLAVGIDLEFGCRDGGVAVTGVEQGDANHQGAGEAPGVTLCDGE